MPISRKLQAQAGMPVVFGAALLTLTGCAPPPGGGAVVAGPAPAGMARIWFYREYEPSVSFNVANVQVNGAIVATVPAFGPGVPYDVPPGHYHLAAVSLTSDPFQATDVDLGPGDLVYARIDDLPINDGDQTSFRRDIYYVRIIPPERARGQLAINPM